MIYGSATDKGLIRSNNEDNYAVCTNSGEYPLVFVLADGMGGHRKGELASALAVEYAKEKIDENIGSLESIEQISKLLTDITERANVKVYLGSLDDSDNKGMGTTLTIAAIYDETLLVSHVGDCRVYLLRKNSLMRITVDHTLVQELVDMGKIIPSQAGNHPKRHILTRALGVPEYISADTYAVSLEKNDKILLCSDGLHGFVPEQVIKSILKKERNPAVAAQNLVNKANMSGGEDNVTVIVGYY
ncbi:MAG: Stp1/IreP family PP2C-type Ser/Thr phosphatase [Saccharofermentanales bacterium]